MPSKTRDLRTRLHNLSKDVLIDLVCEIQKSNSRHDQINDIIQQVKEAREAPQLQQFTTSSTLLQSNVNHTKKKMKSKKRQSLERPFDFSIYHQRHIALKFSYFGEEYYGLARQANTNETIEHYLFQALVLTKLIPPETIGFPKSFSRCGRTDKGVSAYGQVIGITVRSKILLSDRKYTNSNQLPGTGSEEEIDYCLYLNRVLPSTIRYVSIEPHIFDSFSISRYLHILESGAGPLLRYILTLALVHCIVRIVFFSISIESSTLNRCKPQRRSFVVSMTFDICVVSIRAWTRTVFVIFTFSMSRNSKMRKSSRWTFVVRLFCGIKYGV